MTVFTSEQKSLDAAIMTLAKNVKIRTSETGAVGAFTTAHIINGVYHQTDGGTPGTRTTPTATAIVAAIRGCAVGTSFRLLVHNADAADTLTVAAGTGVTGYGPLTVAAGLTREFVFVVTNVDTPAVAMYGLAVTV